MNVETNISYIVNMLAGGNPYYFTYFALCIIACHAGKSVRIYLFILCKFSNIIQYCTFAVCKKRASLILLQCIKLSFIHRCLDTEIPAYVNTEKTDIDTSHLFTYKQSRFRRQLQLFIQLRYLGK